MIAAALAASLFGLIPGSDAKVSRYQVKPWTVTVRQDRASGQVECVISGHRLKVYGDVIVVDLGRDADTSRAYFAVPGHAPAPAQATWPRNMPGRIVDRTPLGNPSDGVIAIPLAPVLGAERLEVMQNLKARPRRFDVRGLEAARDREASAGCPK